MAEFMASTSPIIPVTPRRATFYGSGGALFGIYLRNILLTILTLGVYYFWGKNRTRSYLVGQVEFEGDRFAWHGTGKELFLGTLKLGLIAVPLVAVVGGLPLVWESEWTELITNLVAGVAYAVLVPLAVVGSRKYRMSRISWRGIRFSFRGRMRDYLKILFRGSFMSTITFGLYYPYFQVNTRKFATEHSYFGNARFGFDGQGRDLFGRFLLVVVAVGAMIGIIGYTVVRSALRWPADAPVRDVIGPFLSGLLLDLIGAPLVAVVLAVVAWFWFAAYRQQYYWSHTSFGPARFRSTITAVKLFGLSVTNLLLLVLTLGLAIPWVMARNARFALSNLVLMGSLDLSRIVQDAQAAAATGESLADVLDVDFFGVDLPL